MTDSTKATAGCEHKLVRLKGVNGGPDVIVEVGRDSLHCEECWVRSCTFTPMTLTTTDAHDRLQREHDAVGELVNLATFEATALRDKAVVIAECWMGRAMPAGAHMEVDHHLKRAENLSEAIAAVKETRGE